MATTIFISNFTPTTLLYFLPLTTSPIPIFAINITHLLSSYPELSDFTNLLFTTAVAADLTDRSSVTLLVGPNTFLRNSDVINNDSPSTNFGDVIRYHVLLEYFSWPDFHLIPPTEKLVTTLFQTTGRGPNNFGSVNITTLIDGHNFNVAASMLTASGVEEEFENDEGGAGITLFVPTDQAFTDVSSSMMFQSLPAEEKADVLRFPMLHSYYPLGSLQSIVNPVQLTLATEQNGAGSFTLNISRVNGSLSIQTGVVIDPNWDR
ncbi:hypothetical protein RND71_017706 [Anisodus tanguticus]|uniref:FAS1 domain-containing protein n=1 Tax=Anisodus tanguticus TaxID=243964 RepID=A0AAE1S2W1_9SOLA|nr:hypothetical protein RND71_017706 [Anisodus tanguticus]